MANSAKDRIIHRFFPESEGAETQERITYSQENGIAWINLLLEEKPADIAPFTVEIVLDEKIKDIDLFGRVKNKLRERLIDTSLLPFRFKQMPDIILERGKYPRHAKPSTLTVLVNNPPGFPESDIPLDILILNKSKDNGVGMHKKKSQALISTIGKDTGDVAIILYDQEPVAAIRYSSTTHESSAKGWPKAEIAFSPFLFQEFPQLLVMDDAAPR